MYGPDLAHVHDQGYAFTADAMAPGILALLGSVRDGGGTVHDVGCGSGALTRHLAGAGHRVVATDASPDMCALARRHVPAADVHELVLPDGEVPDAAREVDAVVSTGHVLAYLPDEAAIQRALVLLAGTLRPGGVLVLDLCDEPFAARTDDHPVHARVADDWSVITRFERPRPGRYVREITTFRLRTDGTWRRADETHVNVLLPPDEPAGWLRDAGLDVDVVERLGDADLLPGMYALVARRP